MSAKDQVSVRDHKDYQTEVERLEFTKEYIRTVLEISKGNKEFFVENMKHLLPNSILRIVAQATRISLRMQVFLN